MEKVIIGNATLYHGDCLEIEDDLSCDLVVTDPPYLLTSGGNNGNWNIFQDGKKYNNNGQIVSCDIGWLEIMTFCYNRLKSGNHAYIMSNNRNLEEALRQFRESGFKLHNIIVWDKCTVTPNRFYMNGIEFCIFGYKEKTKYIKNMSLSNLFKAPNTKGNGHPTEKPVGLMRTWIEQSSNVGDIVLDPFMGSGTTGIASIELGRKFIGAEVDKRYFDIACERIEKSQNQGNFF